MCFKNLPIEFDEQGKPFLRAGVANPYGPAAAIPRGAPAQLTAERIEELLKRNGYIKDLNFDPSSRRYGTGYMPRVAKLNAEVARLNADNKNLLDAKKATADTSLDAFRASAKSAANSPSWPSAADSDRLYDGLTRWRGLMQ